MARILGIESTCDETAAAIVADGRRVLSNVVASQAHLHAKYRGVVPEIASRAHIENILPVIREALQQANIALADLDAIAVAHRPGLIGSLLIGVTAAKTLAWALQKPLIGVDHLHAHLYSVMLDPTLNPEPRTLNPPLFPALGLVISGGHTALYHMDSFADVRLIGSTIDDAVGEAYDKVAAILGLGYPGGPIIDNLALTGDPIIKFPRTLLERDSLDFSFSGLKTSVLYHVRGVPAKNVHPYLHPPMLGGMGSPGRKNSDARARPPHDNANVGWAPPTSSPTDTELANISASFQSACIDVLTTKLKRAVKRIKAKSILIGGGVSANRGLRTALSTFPLPVLFPPLQYCTDNAAMSAALAHLFYAEGNFSPLTLDAIPHSQFSR